jgi:hypothetical protein
MQKAMRDRVHPLLGIGAACRVAVDRATRRHDRPLASRNGGVAFLSAEAGARDERAEQRVVVQSADREIEGKGRRVQCTLS